MFHSASVFAVTAFVLLSIVALPADAAASVRPHRATGGAQFVSETEFVGSGQATHLGRYTEAGTVAIVPTVDPAILSVTGAIVYTAADGDELHATVVGEIHAPTGAVTATLTYVGGSGRFAAASGSSDLAGQMLGGGAIAVDVRGSVEY
jgi:hypothetical protein